jgi:hypothetical protein
VQGELADTMGQIRSAMASLSDQDGMMRDGSAAAAAASAAASAQVAPDPQSDDPAAAAAAAAEEVWLPAHDPRCHRVKLLESQGELAAAAQLMRLVLAEMDPRAQRPKLRRYLRHLTDQIGVEQRGSAAAAQPAPEGSLPAQGGPGSAATAQPHAAAPAEPGSRSTAMSATAINDAPCPPFTSHSASIMSSRGLVRTLSARECSRKQSAEAEAELHARDSDMCEGSARLLSQAATVFSNGGALADSLVSAGFDECVDDRGGDSTPRRRGVHGFWVDPATGTTVEMDPARLAGGLQVSLPVQPGAEADIAEWVELTLAADPTGSSFGTKLRTWITDYLHMGQAAAAAAVEDMKALPDNSAVDVGLSKLPTPEELAQDIGRVIDTGRSLTIFSWGDALCSKHVLRQKGSQLDVNAKPLNGRGGGANTKFNALQDRRVMRNVAASMCQGTGALMLQRTVARVESDNLDCMSVYCARGRHRSVSMAEILRARYWPNAQVYHLTIK